VKDPRARFASMNELRGALIETPEGRGAGAAEGAVEPADAG
jgi:hypothetical protein